VTFIRLSCGLPGRPDQSLIIARAKKQVKQMSESKRKEIMAQIQAQKKEGAKPHLSMVVIGHVDAGKSTIMGHLLHLCGFVDKKTITKYERESKNQGSSLWSLWSARPALLSRNVGASF